MMNLIDKISSYVIVSHFKQDTSSKILLLSKYFTAIVICSGIIFYSFMMLFS